MSDLKKLSKDFNLPYLDTLSPIKNDDFYTRVPLSFLRTHRVVPVEESDTRLVLALSEVSQLDVLDHLVSVVNKSVQGALCAPELIDSALQELEKKQATSSDKMMENLQEEGILPLSKQNGLTQNVLDQNVSGAMIKLVNRILIQATQHRATDIHIQANEKQVVIRFRVDGMLYDRETFPLEALESMVSRIKIMSGLDIAEKRLPQDGRTTIELGDQKIDVRVSVVPSAFGERVVLRLLDKTSLKLEFEALGFSSKLSKKFQHAIEAPHGILLVTGPTGSGKTTSLYAALNALETKTKNIMTVEDPIEYRFEGISQMQVKPEIGFHFSTGLRSLLRQDPDVLMVGEIRDKETAEVAVQAALTGHLVLSTLHTNDAISALTRLQDIGVEPYLIASTVRGVLAQRLVRLICQECQGKGCDRCFESGYCGRTGIYEYLELDESIKQALLEGKSENDLKKMALKNGMEPLSLDGASKIKKKLTTKEEVLRVTT